MQIKEFTINYIKKLTQILNQIDVEVIEQIIHTLEETINKNKIFIIGNGGSAATASHMANDLGVGLKRREIISFNIDSLTDNTPAITAIANDIGYENIFYSQLKNVIKKNDVLIAISCSGNSENIIKAVKYAKEQNAKIIGVTGFDGGELKKLSDINFHIDTQKAQYGIVEDAHMILDHIIYSYYINKDLNEQ
ncbi:D-sedoheptulose-7-phosphate isomerase [Malaciobacter mytili]|uniref:Sugar isomerase n=1 Tax=Malaciobacter mytili LMG 24559 TaxID=1032238 RepID=A0AAX2AJH0_9BACT|nr:SIS domain-containing protein [Malaciobacter mytili]AXH16133.1 phosphoheptose isomerase [Malaciobacter mytili LMG 24559]RXK17033.1 sugar isomerase [Malaciobacter mytili LMG 24559]